MSQTFIPTFYLPAKVGLLPEDERKGFPVMTKYDLLEIPHINKISQRENFIDLFQYKTSLKSGWHSLIATFETESMDPEDKYLVIGYLNNLIPEIELFVPPVTKNPEYVEEAIKKIKNNQNNA